jgi:hypothetical protein
MHFQDKDYGVVEKQEHGRPVQSNQAKAEEEKKEMEEYIKKQESYKTAMQ